MAMKNFHHHDSRRSDHPDLGRRRLLQVGGMALLGTSLADLLRLEAQAVPMPLTQRARAKSVVFIFQSGGPSQHETFDPKPNAPDGIRGEYQPIATSVPGIRICEHLPMLAQQAGRFSILRSVWHGSDTHGVGVHWNLTGMR